MDTSNKGRLFVQLKCKAGAQGTTTVEIQRKKAEYKKKMKVDVVMLWTSMDM
jgi:hypothetical protein